MFGFSYKDPHILKDIPLYDRRYVCTIGETELSDFDIEFSVKKTLKDAAPNTCTVKIYNLSKDTRDKLAKDKKAVGLRLEAGYKDNVSQIFLGEVRYALSYVEGPDIITEFTCGDKEKNVARSRCKITLAPKTPMATALEQVATVLTEDLGVGTIKVGKGNLDEMVAKIARTGQVICPSASVLTGSTARILTDICRGAGIEWSIQDGRLLFLDIGQAYDIHPFVLSADSGMIGEPSVDIGTKEGDTVDVETLMLPYIWPGSKVQLETFSVSGLYRVYDAHYMGESRGEKWGIKMTCHSIPDQVLE